MSSCRGCGKAIEWGVTEEGKRIPLDPTPPVYSILSTQPGDLKVARNHEAMVSHFATCPDANKFSGSNKERAGGRPA